MWRSLDQRRRLRPVRREMGTADRISEGDLVIVYFVRAIAGAFECQKSSSSQRSPRNNWCPQSSNPARRPTPVMASIPMIAWWAHPSAQKCVLLLPGLGKLSSYLACHAGGLQEWQGICLLAQTNA